MVGGLRPCGQQPLIIVLFNFYVAATFTPTPPLFHPPATVSAFLVSKDFIGFDIIILITF